MQQCVPQGLAKKSITIVSLTNCAALSEAGQVLDSMLAVTASGKISIVNTINTDKNCLYTRIYLLP